MLPACTLPHILLLTHARSTPASDASLGEEDSKLEEQGTEEEPLGSWQPTHKTNYIHLYYEAGAEAAEGAAAADSAAAADGAAPPLVALLVGIPKNGVVVELLSTRAPEGVALATWDLCAPTAAVAEE